MAWEKLRIVYNAVLVAVVITVTAIGGMKSDWELVRYLIACAMVANLVYCAGPVAEGYAALFAIPRRASRIVLFTLGLLISACFAFAGMISFSMRDF